jgi:hypothetical protein
VAIADEKYVVLATRPPSGDPATTRARLVPLSDGRIGLWPEYDVVADGQAVTVCAEHVGSPELAGTAEVVRSGRAYDESRVRIRRKYGWRGRLARTDPVVLVRLHESWQVVGNAREPRAVEGWVLAEQRGLVAAVERLVAQPRRQSPRLGELGL